MTAVRQDSRPAPSADPRPWPTRRPLVAILRGITPQEAVDHARVLVEAGFDCIEVPTNSPQWARSVAAIHAAFGPGVLVGAGTVTDAGLQDELLATGAPLMVTPNTDPALIARGVRLGLTTVIGCATASEAFAALQAGAVALKLFPAGPLGPGYVSALRAVLPRGLPLLAVGGIRPGNLGDFMRAGCDGAGLGSDLYRPGQSPTQTAIQAQIGRAHV